MSNNSVAIITLVVGIIAAVGAIIAAIPQLPQVWRMLVPPRAYVEFDEEDSNIVVSVKNSKLVSIDPLIIVLTFHGASEVMPQARFTPHAKMSNGGQQGFFNPPAFTATGDNTFQASLSEIVGRGGRVSLGRIRVTWEAGTVHEIEWETSIHHKILRTGKAHFS